MNKTIKKVLAKYPKEIVDFFQSDIKISDWQITKKLSIYLPSPFQQFINKIKKIKSEEEYEVIFTFKRGNNESDKNG